MSIVDAAEREAALDPLHSFCVSAPAGSGKTELLIQRFLALLARVERPEQVLAITFTRKAAAEMRERVMQALHEARAGEPCSSPHQQRTRDLALAALAVDERQGWQLMANAARLSIRTIDGFCGALTRQMPVLSHFGAQVRAVDDADPLYAEAVAELFALLETQYPVVEDLQQLMLHFDNHWDRLAELLKSLLARREQWLTYLGVGREPLAAQAALEQLVAAMVVDALGDLQRQMGPFLGELYELQCFAAQQKGEQEPPGVPTARVEDLPAWQALRHFLLTRDGKWRSRITRTEGFPADKGRPAEMKARLQSVLAELSACEGLSEALQEVTLLPTPGEDSESWRLVVHLTRVLPVLAAQLLLVFERRGSVDHSQVAQSALQALGDDDAPTDLALRLDYRIEHILVDEFQDTAINQYELLRRLTRGWAEHNEMSPGRPRTFLIVGDGMQSIYGFRDANVGLFLQARDRGFNGVVPRYLELRSNFRSEAGVVNWVNTTFARAFPAQDNIGRGEVAFSTAQSVKPGGDGEAVRVQVFHGDNAASAEVSALCDGVAAALAEDAEGTVAILGRSRPQLQDFVQGLQRRGIAFAAQDMDRLSQSSVIMDLMSLVRVLANSADRVAWAALLRGPYCGLTLSDLHRLLVLAPSDPMAVATELELGAVLSNCGQRAVAHLAAAMAWAEQQRDRLSQRAWLELLWLRLGGPATAASTQLLNDAERFFQLLEQGELEGRVLDVPWLQNQLERLYADAGGAGARVQIMTLHKAKGLEFDHVFIPALGKGSRSDERALFLWDEITTRAGDSGFLLAADDHSEKESAGLYNFLASQRKRKRLLENTRLLYVGATRAIRRLTLSACLSEDRKKGGVTDPGAQSLLATIWPAVADIASVVEAQAGDAVTADEARGAGGLLRQRQLPPSAPAIVDLNQGTGNLPEAAHNRLERHVGTVIHQNLERLATLPVLPQHPGADEESFSVWALASLGLSGDALAQGLERVIAALHTTLADEVAGRWLLRSDHPASHCELPLTRVREDGVINDIVIDRCFVDAGTGERWIVDYKSSRPPEGMPLEHFLQEEVVRYGEQLAGYRDAMASLGTEPLRCALYFTALAQLVPVDVS
ncbi:UvrD-helicase domain-containing protein [Parahaliea aestuarii]|uniref:DNA 3'-5' helicase n=1 Tax=Parahaliea aestuarii TaxID=1852021 RepID=A0A5C8ZTM7_9GAMM|nr:UvrD-helicase domain-containing protein [Parahaliea aestuarii]TXS91149.1 AAA family ATPase [Parahaliea aestuarii]